MSKLAGLTCAPIVGGIALAVAAATTLFDVLTTPWVWAARRRAKWPDAPPPTTNASIVVLNYNGVRFLGGLLPSLEVAVGEAPGDHEIIVVDNGSDDGSAAWVRANHPAVRLVELPENLFFIRGNRAGVEAASGDVLVFVNNDMRVEPGFLRELLAPFARGDVFAVSGHIEMVDQRVETGRTRGEFRRGAFHLVHVDGPRAAAVPTFWAGGGSSAFDRAKFEHIGGFEELYDPCYVEDVSLSYQAWRRGWRVLFAADSVVHHFHQGTSSTVFRRAQLARLVRRNRELFVWRSVTDFEMLWSHALYLPWNVIKEARRTSTWDELRGLAAALPRLPRALAARPRSRALARRSDREVLRLANDVSCHLDDMVGNHRRHTVVLSLGRSAAGADDLGSAALVDGTEIIEHTIDIEPGNRRAGELRDQLRDLLREHDHDVVYFRDAAVLQVVPPAIRQRPAVVRLREPAELSRQSRLLLSGVDMLVCSSDREAAALRAAGMGVRVVDFSRPDEWLPGRQPAK